MAQSGIDFLLGQHQQVSELLVTVETGPPDSRQQSFDELRELLAVHETAEELILRPVTRRSAEGGDAVADARFAEENQAKDILSKLEKLDVSSEEFTAMFASFAGDVRQHAHNEETLEFPLVAESEDQKALESMTSALQLAEKIAPTHPHPSARSNAANVVLGPFAAMVDRVRDALSSH